MVQINHTGPMILSITTVTVCICGQIWMMISVTMDGSMMMGHAPAAVTTYVKRIIEYYHCENFI